MRAVPELHTNRLVLRAYRRDDLETVYLMTVEPDIIRFLPDRGRVSRQAVLASLPRRLETWKKQGFGQLGVFEKESGRLVGYCGLKYLDGTTEVEIYYGFFREFWGKGIAAEAAAAVLRFGFEEAGLGRIVGVTHTENTGSQRVLEKIGLRRESQAASYGMDVYYFSLERKDYISAIGEYSVIYRESDDIQRAKRQRLIKASGS